jgi:hypothetical protein
MEEAGTFDLADHTFTCYLPSSDAEDQVWTIIVTKHGETVRRETIPLMYRPVWGPDVGDCAARDARVEEIIKELGLE